MGENNLVEPYLQEHAMIGRRNVWHYLICSTIGYFYIVEYEKPDMTIETTVILNDNDKACRLFKKYCNKVLSGM